MTYETTKSRAAYEQAQKLMPGGVNSPVRAAQAVACEPVFIQEGKGSYIWDIDGNRYRDYVGSWGALLLGHAHPRIVEAVQAAAERGLSYGAPTVQETLFAEELLAAYPSLERVRLVNSGTEATMSALRLARGVTGRDYIVKFEGCYHGHSDALLVKAGSGALTTGIPTSAGVTTQTAAHTLVARYNSTEDITELFARHGSQIAAVIVEPVAGNMGVVVPRQGFLETLRQLTQDAGSLLIFDEVMTGCRVAHGGAQAVYGIDPDLTCLGKVIGGGLPLAAYGGKACYLQQVSPIGSVYQAGTLAGNPLAVAAGLATMELLKQEGLYESLETTATTLAKGIRDLGQAYGVPLQVNQKGAMLSLFFTAQEVFDLASASTADALLYAQLYRALLQAGVYLPPSQFEAWFISTAHSDEDIHSTLQAIEEVFKTGESFRQYS